jgi:CheY-like chemotaxis protein
VAYAAFPREKATFAARNRVGGFRILFRKGGDGGIAGTTVPENSERGAAVGFRWKRVRMAIKILIVDDHVSVRKSLKRVLEGDSNLSVVGEGVDGLDGVAKAETLQPDVVLMDISMPRLNGIDATRLISERLPKTKVLILSMYDSVADCQRAVNAGALGYVLKESAGEEILSAISTVMAGHRFFGAGVVHLLADGELPTRTGRWRCGGKLRVYLSG